MKHQSPIQESRTVQISTVNNDIHRDNSYYTIIGKLKVEPGEVKTMDGNRRVKEDNTIIDKTRQIGLWVSSELIEEILK